jgi:outer membrane biogenesis lipoprotein LolB
MKKQTLLFTSALSAMLLLAACNTTEDDNSPVDEQTAGSTDETTDTQDKGKENEEETSDGASEETSNGTSEETSDEASGENAGENAEGAQSTIQYVDEKGQQQEAKLSWTTSPEQDYEIALAEGFTLTAEEPGRDMVAYEANEQISMRIETFSKDETNYEEMAQQTESTVGVTAPDGQYQPYDIKNLIEKNKEIQHAAGYIVTFAEDEEQVVTVIYEKESKIVRLTVFDRTSSEVTDALLEMGLTVK